MCAFRRHLRLKPVTFIQALSRHPCLPQFWPEPFDTILTAGYRSRALRSRVIRMLGRRRDGKCYCCCHSCDEARDLRFQVPFWNRETPYSRLAMEQCSSADTVFRQAPRGDPTTNGFASSLRDLHRFAAMALQVFTISSGRRPLALNSVYFRTCTSDDLALREAHRYTPKEPEERQP